MAREFVRPKSLTVQKSLLILAERICSAPELGVAEERLIKSAGVKEYGWNSDARIYKDQLGLTATKLYMAGPIGKRTVEATFRVIDGDGAESTLHVQRNDSAQYYEDDYARDVLEKFNAFYEHEHSRCLALVEAGQARQAPLPNSWLEIISSES
jgi:hypothetical protein